MVWEVVVPKSTIFKMVPIKNAPLNQLDQRKLHPGSDRTYKRESRAPMVVEVWCEGGGEGAKSGPNCGLETRERKDGELRREASCGRTQKKDTGAGVTVKR